MKFCQIAERFPGYPKIISVQVLIMLLKNQAAVAFSSSSLCLIHSEANVELIIFVIELIQLAVPKF